MKTIFQRFFKTLPSLKSDSGQTLLEFVLLMLVLISMSLIMMGGFNGGVADRWMALVRVIAGPTTSDIQLP
jgi:hypothetical protein